VDGVTPQGLLRFRPADVKPRDEVRIWLAHLALSAAGAAAGPARLVARDCELRWRIPADPRAILGGLIAGYRAAVAAPLPVFEQASQELVVSRNRRVAPLEAARAKFRLDDQGWSGRRGDLADPYVALCWRGRDPFETHAAAFEQWSRVLWAAALEHREKA
jgi:exodeoxyribonuclease V gamma subunit